MTEPGQQDSPFPSFALLGMRLACVDGARLLDHLFTCLAQERGGWLITANLDFLRRYVRDANSRALYAAADLRVADGMPLVWAARLQGDRLPERVAGSALVPLIAERAARENRTIYFLGGEPNANTGAVAVLRKRFPALLVCGSSSPMVSSPPSAEQVATLRDELVRARPDILLVGLGSPKQEQLIRDLRPHLPRTWLIGVGVSFSFVAGDIRRAPELIQRVGLEWLWRLGQEPKRLARRYLVEDLPFAFELFGRTLLRGLKRRWRP